MSFVAHPSNLVFLGGLSIALFLISALAIPWYLIRLPADLLTRDEAPPLSERPLQKALLVVLKNVLGLVLLVLGILMLFLPGQGILTIAVALSLLDFPGKRQLQRRVLSRPNLLDAVNKLRAKANRPPLAAPRASRPPGTTPPSA